VLTSVENTTDDAQKSQVKTVPLQPTTTATSGNPTHCTNDTAVGDLVQLLVENDADDAASCKGQFLRSKTSLAVQQTIAQSVVCWICRCLNHHVVSG